MKKVRDGSRERENNEININRETVAMEERARIKEKKSDTESADERGPTVKELKEELMHCEVEGEEKKKRGEEEVIQKDHTGEKKH